MKNILSIPIFLATALAAAPVSAQTTSSADKEITVLGYLEPIEDRTLTTSEAGRISDIFLKEGDPVAEGQAILKLDTTAHDSGLEIAKLQRDSTASVDAATAEKELAKIKVDALERLGPSSRNPSEYLRGKANLLIAESKLQAALEEKAVAGHQVKKLEGEIARRYIVSPVDGVVTRISLDVSEFLSPSEDSVVHVVKLDKLRVVVHVKQIYAKNLTVGMALPIEVVGEAEKTAGTIEYINDTMDPASGTFRVKLVIENPELKFRAGAQALVSVAKETAS